MRHCWQKIDFDLSAVSPLYSMRAITAQKIKFIRICARKNILCWFGMAW